MIRFLASLVLAAFLPTPAAATTTALPDPLIAERLACLVRPKKPAFPEAHKHDRREGLMRFKLRFEPGQRKPKVEVLHATAASDMQELAFEYVEGYRLPCLQAGDPPVSLFQELYFSGAPDPAPLPLQDRIGQEACVVMPREAPDFGVAIVQRNAHVIAQARFEGDAQSPPQVRFIHSSGSKRFEGVVREYLGQYRMPCRTGSERPFEFEQTFTLRIQGERHSVLTRSEFGLRELLGFVQDPDKLVADFDLNSMACPFKVSLAMRQPTLPNAVKEIGPSDPNRTALLHWLSELRFAWKNARQAADLFGSEVTVTIPCGLVKLNPPPPPQGEPS